MRVRGVLVVEKSPARSLAPVVQNRRLYNQGGAFLAPTQLDIVLTTVKSVCGRIGSEWLPIDGHRAPCEAKP